MALSRLDHCLAPLPGQLIYLDWQPVAKPHVCQVHHVVRSCWCQEELLDVGQPRRCCPGGSALHKHLGMAKPHNNLRLLFFFWNMAGIAIAGAKHEVWGCFPHIWGQRWFLKTCWKKNQKQAVSSGQVNLTITWSLLGVTSERKCSLWASMPLTYVVCSLRRLIKRGTSFELP